MKCPESANVMTDSASFCCVWPLLEGDVEEGIRRCLRARMVSGPRGQADLAALDDIRQEVALKVMKMCSRGMFRPQESAKPRLEGSS